jgi:hypothetical protein
VTGEPKISVRRKTIRGAVAGAVILNIPTVVWAFFFSAGSIVIVAIVLTALGAVLGGMSGWATARRWRLRRGAAGVPATDPPSAGEPPSRSL